MKGVKGIGVTKFDVSKEFLILLAPTQVFHKKSLFDFGHIYILFVDVRYILDNCMSQGLALEA